jgi:hypothetical protein
MRGRIKRWLTPEEDERLQESRREANDERKKTRQRVKVGGRPNCSYDWFGGERLCPNAASECGLCKTHLRKIKRDKALRAADPETFVEKYVEYLNQFDIAFTADDLEWHKWKRDGISSAGTSLNDV